MLKHLVAVIICFTVCLIYADKPCAQLCTGSLGDPVVNITFGNVSTPLLPGQTTYLFNTCPNDGEYTIASSTPSCHAQDNSWHSTGNHTPNDVNGMMMIVNASSEPGDFYVDTVHGLCSNTTYEFAAWIVNLLAPGSPCYSGGTIPNITFSIEEPNRTVIQKYSTGDILATDYTNWQQYGFYFKNTNTSDVVLRLTNNGPGGCGNDLALDDITFRPCGPLVNASIKSTNGNTMFNICQNQKDTSIILESQVSSGYESPAYQWQRSIDNSLTWIDITGATNTVLPLTINTATAASTLYRLSIGQSANINSVECRISSNPITVNVNANPNPSFTSNSNVCVGKDLQLTVHNGATYNWTGPSGFTSKDSIITITNASVSNAGTYTVTATTSVGCSGTASTYLSVNPNPVAAVSSNTSLCEGSSVRLEASGGTAYTWLPSTGLSDAASANPLASPVDTTTYQLIVNNSSGCTDTAFTTINVWKRPFANAGPNKTIKEGESVQLDGKAGGTNVTYNWLPNAFISNPHQLQPIVSPAQDTTYTLEVQSQQGCGTAEDKVFVRVFKKVDVPNTFSPNGDGVNDVWYMKNINTYPDAEITVVNRYGVPVYKGRGSSKPWDGTYNGKPLPAATYYYSINLQQKDFPVLSGWLLILR